MVDNETSNILKRLIGKRIKAARQNANITQQQLSETIPGLSSLAHYEVGKAFPSVQILYSIAHELGVKISDLLPDM